MAAVDACRWSTLSIPHAPYVTSLPWISHYGCYYVAHGDDITSDSHGEDCYRFVKAAGRFLVFKRTPGISTTDLVGRMLLYTKTHFIKSFAEVLLRSDESSDGERADMLQRIQDYASDETGFKPGCDVWICRQTDKVKSAQRGFQTERPTKLVGGIPPRPGQRVVYVDGGFDLFSSGHITFLQRVSQAEKQQAYIVAGVHEDDIINRWKGLNYPIMNIFERGLCVLQCRYVNAVVFGAPFAPSKEYLETLPYGRVDAVYHGPTAFMPVTYDPYADARTMGIFRQVELHPFAHVNAGEIVTRILKGREAFEERQRKKGEKAIGEEAVRQQEILDQQEREKERQGLLADH